jgi:hypothetical protein
MRDREMARTATWTESSQKLLGLPPVRVGSAFFCRWPAYPAGSQFHQSVLLRMKPDACTRLCCCCLTTAAAISKSCRRPACLALSRAHAVGPHDWRSCSEKGDVPAAKGESLVTILTVSAAGCSSASPFKNCSPHPALSCSGAQSLPLRPARRLTRPAKALEDVLPHGRRRPGRAALEPAC